jgi:hypothetical protein
MKINKSYLREKLKNVYWLNGGPCFLENDNGQYVC